MRDGARLAGERNRFVVTTAALAALNGLLFGFDTGVISGALLYIGETFPALEQSAFLEGVVVSGALVGAALGGRLADVLGRRRLIILGACIFFVASLGMATAWSVEWLIAARIFNGVAIGFASIVGPLYISEIYPLNVRGTAMGVATVVNWLANLAIEQLFDLIGPAFTSWLFALLTGVAVAFSHSVVPETNGRTLEEIEADLRETALGNERLSMADRAGGVGSGGLIAPRNRRSSPAGRRERRFRAHRCETSTGGPRLRRVVPVFVTDPMRSRPVRSAAEACRLAVDPARPSVVGPP